MRTPRHFTGAESRGFTLVELLAVMGIIIIIIGVTSPSLVGFLGASAVTKSGQMISNTFKAAHIYATTHNKNVEMRFYKFASSQYPVPQYRAFQILEISGLDAAGQPVYTPLAKINMLPDNVSFVETVNGVDYSNLLDSTLVPVSPVKTPVPAFGGSSYTYTCFLFRPNGSTNLPSQATPYYVSVAPANPSPALENFFAVQIDAQNAGVIELHP